MTRKWKKGEVFDTSKISSGKLIIEESWDFMLNDRMKTRGIGVLRQIHLNHASLLNDHIRANPDKIALLHLSDESTTLDEGGEAVSGNILSEIPTDSR